MRLLIAVIAATAGCGSKSAEVDGGLGDAASDAPSDGSAVCAPSEPGTLDRAFGENGVVRIFGLQPNVSALANGVSVDAQSRIVVVGGFIAGARSCVISRLLPDGGRDVTFGAGGIVRDSVSGSVCWYNAVAFQPDGKIIVAGDINGHVHSRAVVARYLDNGERDMSFGVDGFVVSESELVTSALAVSVMSTGEIVVGGETVDGNTASGFVKRYLADGSPDVSFGTEGTAQPAFTTGSDTVFDVALQSDGKVIAVGGTEANSMRVFGVVRYNADGTRDPGFGTSGLATIAFGADAESNGVALTPSGDAVVIGSALSQGQRVGAISKLTQTGDLDINFGDAGKLVDNVKPGLSFVGVDATPGNNILAVGLSDEGYGSLALVRYRANGDPDASFGYGGVGAPIPLALWRHMGTDVASQPDGHVVVVGGYGDTTQFDMLVARYCR